MMPEVSLFFADVATINDDRVGDYFNSLPPAIQAHVGVYTDADARKLSLCGMVMLGEMLKGWGYSLSDVRYNEWGKPIIDGNNGFNISHSGTVVVCAGGMDMKVGVDIEQIKSADKTLYRDYFTEKEWDSIQSAGNRTEAFYRMWVRKEAVLKAVGKGVFLSLHEVDVCGDEVVCDGWTFYLKDVFIKEGYVVCVAGDGPFVCLPPPPKGEQLI